MHRYKITVWVVRLVVKKAPTWSQIRQDRRWCTLADLREAGPVAGDDALLRRLRQANPFYRFPGIREKYVRTVADGQRWAVPLKTCQWQVRVCREARARVLEQVTRGASPSADRRIRRHLAHWIPLESHGAIPVLNGDAAPYIRPGGPAALRMSRMQFSGYRFVNPGGVDVLTGDIPFTPAPQGADRQAACQDPEDFVFFTVTPV